MNHRSRSDKTSHTDRQTENTVNLSQNNPIKAVKETSLVPDFCHHRHVLDCIHFDSHIVTAITTKKKMSLVGSSHK
jgi:hypothetical protein